MTRPDDAATVPDLYLERYRLGELPEDERGRIERLLELDPALQGRLEALKGSDAPPIGKLRHFEYASYAEQLAPGETLALYTRGAATCTDAAGERFGEHQFIELVCDGFGQSPATTLQDVTDELTAFFAEGKHPDDITIVLLHHIRSQS